MYAAARSIGSVSEETLGTGEVTVSTDGRPRFLSDISASSRIGRKRRRRQKFQYNG
jgi:hypothetical protein